MKPVLRFLILLFVFALGQQSFAYSWNKVDIQKNLLTTNCQLSELQMDITVCNDSIFVAEVSFVTNNPNPFGYYVLIDGVFYTFNQYEDTLTQSFIIEFIDPDLGSEILVEVFDEADITCAVESNFLIDCSDPCDIEATEYEIVDCNPLDSTFYVNVWFEYANLDSLTVSIFGGGYDWGEFDAWEQPMTLGPYYGDQGVYEVIIQDTYDPECFDVLAVDSPSCLNTDCQLSALIVNVEYCTDSIVFLDASFLAENVNPSFVYNIYLNEEFYGYYQYSATNNEQIFDFVIEDPQFGSLYTLEIVDEDDVSCATAIEFVLEPCSNECALSALEVDVEYCTDSIVFFDASFFAEDPASPVYNKILNGEFICFGLYSNSNNEQTFEFAIEDPQFGSIYTLELFDEDDVNCATTIEFELEPCSNECALSALEVDVEYCTDSIVFFDASFLAENQASPVYNKILNGDFIGFGLYSNSNNEQTFEFAIEDPQFGSIYTLELFDEDDVNCATAVEFVLEPCSNACTIDGVDYEVVDCNPSDSTYYVNVWFEYDNTDPLMVSIYGSGYDWGEFDAWEQPIQLGPFYGAEGVPEQIIQNVNDPACATEFGIDSPSCFYSDCYVDITDYTIECIGEDSIFYVELFIEVANLSSDSISVFGGGYDWGEFAAGLESITVGPYFAGNGIYEILISDSSNPDCISFVEFEEPDCIDACDIDIVEYNVVECNETDSLFYLEVFFEYDNLLGDAVSIFGGGYNWGIYNPLLQPILIGPFFTGDLEYEIIVADQLNLDCFDVVGFEFNGCDEECELIEEIWLENGPDCLGDLCEIEIGVDLSQAGAGLPVDIHLDGFSYFDYPVSQLAGQSFTFVQDSLEFSSVVVCISGSFDCCDTLSFDIPPTVVGDVWPGDANSDNIANNIDLLYIGLANGFQGFDRPEQGIEWAAYESEDWDFFFPESGVNFKHADSNGDGLVDEADIEAIEENYGLTHGAYDPDFEIGGPSDPPLYIDLPSYVQPDQLIEAEIILGEFSNQVSDLYGIAFTVEFPDGIFQNNEIEFDSTGSWIGGIDADMYTFSRDANGVFEVDITLVRKDQSNAGTNYGRIGNFIGVIDDVLGLQEASVKIKNVVAISNDETLIQLNLPVDTMIISSSDQILEDDKIHVYPVPTNKFLYLETDIADDVSSMEIITLEGVRVRHFDHFESRLDLKELHNGVYLLRVRTSKGASQDRIMIFN